MFFKAKKTQKGTQNQQIGIINSGDNFSQQVGIINNNDSQSNSADNSDGSIGISNEPGAINYGTQIDVMNLD